MNTRLTDEVILNGVTITIITGIKEDESYETRVYSESDRWEGKLVAVFKSATNSEAGNTHFRTLERVESMLVQDFEESNKRFLTFLGG